MSALDYLEARVAKKFAAAAAARNPHTPDIDLDLSDWCSSVPLPPGTPTFPREQWVTSPNRRLVTLITIDRALDVELNDEQWAQVALLMQYGGRERVA